MITKKSDIILGAMALEGNPYDGHTLKHQLEQASDLIGRLPTIAFVDRSNKERKEILGVNIMLPDSTKGKTAYEKRRERARLRRRATVEPVIGQLKSVYLMLRNYLKDFEDGMISTIMAAVAFNMMKRLWQVRDAIYFIPDFLTGYKQVKYVSVLIY